MLLTNLSSIEAETISGMYVVVRWKVEGIYSAVSTSNIKEPSQPLQGEECQVEWRAEVGSTTVHTCTITSKLYKCAMEADSEAKKQDAERKETVRRSEVLPDRRAPKRKTIEYPGEVEDIPTKQKVVS